MRQVDVTVASQECSPGTPLGAGLIVCWCEGLFSTAIGKRWPLPESTRHLQFNRKRDIFTTPDHSKMTGRIAGLTLARAYIFGDYRVDVVAFQLWRRDQLITLTPKAFDTLAALIQHRDRAVSKDELLSSVWPDTHVTEDSLIQCISVLRKTLGDDPTNPRLIATVARHGYRFIAPVSEASGDHPLPDNTEPTGLATLHLVPEAPAENRRLKYRTAWLGGALLGGLASLAFAVTLSQWFAQRRTAHEAIPPLHFSVSAPKGTSRISGGILSPNGRYLLLLAENDESGAEDIWIESLASGQSRPIPGTAGASRPFWSPDSQSIGFSEGGKLKRVGVNDQAAQVVASIGPKTSGASWSSKGVILFSEGRSGLYSVPETGGAAVPVTTLNRGEQEVAHRSPQFLPDGNHFLYFDVSARPDREGTWLGSLRSKQVERVLDVPAIFAQPGYLVYLRDHLLMAQPFDWVHPQTRHAPQVIGEDTFSAQSIDESTLSTPNVSVSANGMLAYTNSGGMPKVKWFDRSGRQLATVDMPVPVISPALSPDQQQLLVAGRILEHGVWQVDLARGVSTRIVPDALTALWSPDGTRIAFLADRAGNSIFARPVGGSNQETLLLRTNYTMALNDWSPDGRYILYTRNANHKNELWTLPMSGEHRPIPFLQPTFNVMQGQISPDGHWVAYASDESGSWEVYLQSFPEPGSKRILSVGGGFEPHWRKDGKELFYLAPDRNLMSVNINLNSSPTIERPRPLFRTSVLPLSTILMQQLVVAADGQRFLIGTVEKTTREDQITVLSSWPSLLSH